MYRAKIKLWQFCVLLTLLALLAGCTAVQSPQAAQPANTAETNATLIKIYQQGYFTYGL